MTRTYYWAFQGSWLIMKTHLGVRDKKKNVWDNLPKWWFCMFQCFNYKWSTFFITASSDISMETTVFYAF